MENLITLRLNLVRLDHLHSLCERDRLLTIEEIAEIVGQRPRTIATLFANGTLPMDPDSHWYKCCTMKGKKQVTEWLQFPQARPTAILAWFLKKCSIETKDAWEFVLSEKLAEVKEPISMVQ